MKLVELVAIVDDIGLEAGDAATVSAPICHHFLQHLQPNTINALIRYCTALANIQAMLPYPLRVRFVQRLGHEVALHLYAPRIARV